MSWTHEEKSAVWWKARAIKDVDGTKWRLDACGMWISWKHYGDRNSRFGWEIDHINPDAGDDVANLQPLQWENNAAKSDGAIVCVRTAALSDALFIAIDS